MYSNKLREKDMMKITTTLVLAMMAAQTLSAQEVPTTQQDSLLQIMNNTAYWERGHSHFHPSPLARGWGVGYFSLLLFHRQ